MILSLFIALLVMAAMSAAGAAGGLWRGAAVVKRQADRVGVGALRGGLIVDRYRLPVLVWALAMSGVAVLVTLLARDRGPVWFGFFAGAALGGAALIGIPAGARRLTGGR